MTNDSYMADFPPMPVDGWASNPDFDLGVVHGLFSVASKSMGSLYGDSTLHLNEDNLLDLKGLNDFSGDHTGAIVYAALWLVAAIIITIVGIIWCCCNKFKCCCQDMLKDAPGDDMDEGWKRAIGKPATIAVLACMAFLLICLLIMLTQSFGANQKTIEGTNGMQPDLNNALLDIVKYLDITIDQLGYVFMDSYNKFSRKIEDILKECNGPKPDCDRLEESVGDALADSNKTLIEDSNTLINALRDVRNEAESIRNKMDKEYASEVMDVNTGMYWLFTLFNILYLAIFVLVLAGTVLVVFAPQSNLKNTGFKLTRVAIGIIFSLAILLVAQMIVLFFSGGILTEAICPAIREIEDKTPDTETRMEAHRNEWLFQDKTPDAQMDSSNSSNSTANYRNEWIGGYKVPSFGKILRDCKAGKSAYMTFDMWKAVHLSSPEEINQKFKDATDEYLPSPSVTVIQSEVKSYTTFVTNALINDVGICDPAYNAMNATINTFCYKIAGPMVGFWFILQFMMSTFLLMIVAGLLFERYY